MRPTLILTAALCFSSLVIKPAAGQDLPENFSREKLVAWCIVPFDAKNRSPSDRASMVSELGLRRVAYDWRQRHVATFEEEILQYKQHGIEYFAFWSWHDAIEPLIVKHNLRPQIWNTCPSPSADTDQERVRRAAAALLPLVNKTKRLGLKFGLYNHGGWGGQPANMVAVCRFLRRHHDADHVGIVYNFHHGHQHMERFVESFADMRPYLLCVNLNGMADAAEVQRDAGKHKILPVGSGRHEASMIRVVIDSGYDGPIGVLGHRSDKDVREVLQGNLDGLVSVLAKMLNPALD